MDSQTGTVPISRIMDRIWQERGNVRKGAISTNFYPGNRWDSAPPASR